jgi:hypothetical protein
MAGGPAPSKLRGAVGDALEWIDDHELVRPIVVGFLVVALLAGFVFIRTVAPSESPGPPRAATSPSVDTQEPVDTPDSVEQPDPVEPSRTAEYENVLGGFAFAYPTDWHLIDSGARAYLVSPDGRIGLEFGPAQGASLEAGSDRTVETIAQGWSDQEVTGTTHEVIAGSRSLLVGGTISEGDRAMRFLAITVRARPSNYAISILAPRGADPLRVLPRVEEIVASFQFLGAAETSV